MLLYSPRMLLPPPHLRAALRRRSAPLLPLLDSTAQPAVPTRPVVAALDTALLLLPSPRYNSDGDELTWREVSSLGDAKSSCWVTLGARWVNAKSSLGECEELAG
jgi:hypothetical protein